MSHGLDAAFADTWASLAAIGRDRGTGGYRRYAWTDADAELREWFADQAQRRAMTCEQDRDGNLWAWWGEPGPGAVVTGSHLDSVPDGGAFDGPLGVVSAFLAIDELRRRGTRPQRPVAVVFFTDEEGARSGVACIGLATSIWPHGRWRTRFEGRGDHAGTSHSPAEHASAGDCVAGVRALAAVLEDLARR